MAFAFQMDAAARARLESLGFDPASLPHAYRESCDLCGWKVFRTVSHIDRYGFDETYQMCEGCGRCLRPRHKYFINKLGKVFIAGGWVVLLIENRSLDLRLY